MGCPSSCNECGKKFKVFGSKKKCKHCMDVVCKACLASHLELKHTRPKGKFKRRKSFDTTGNDEPEELQFLSPFGSPDSELEYADTDELQFVDSIEAASDEDDDGVLRDDDAEDDVEDDELLMKTTARQSCIEEAVQYKELCKIQGMVATWAIKEKHLKQKMRREICDYENCSIFAVSYAVTATVVVWTLCGLLLAIYLGVRSLQAGSSYVR